MSSLNLFVGGYVVVDTSGVEKFYCETHASPEAKRIGKRKRAERGLCQDCFFESQQNVKLETVNQNS